MPELRSTLTVLLLLAPLASRAPAAAQGGGDLNGPLPGEYLLGLDLAYTLQSQDSRDAESLLIRTDVSRFFDSAHQVGVEIDTRFSAVEAGGHAGSVFVGPLYNYNWSVADRTSLYFGGRLGVAFEDVSGASARTDLAYGLQVGLRQWITPRTAIRIEPRYTRVETDSGGLDARDQFDLLLGINLVL